MLKPSSPTATVPVSPPQSRCSSTVTAESHRRLPAPLSRPCVAVSTTTGTTIELRLSVPLFVVVTLADSVHPRIRLTLPPWVSLGATVADRVPGGGVCRRLGLLRYLGLVLRLDLFLPAAAVQLLKSRHALCKRRLIRPEHPSRRVSA